MKQSRLFLPLFLTAIWVIGMRVTVPRVGYPSFFKTGRVNVLGCSTTAANASSDIKKSNAAVSYLYAICLLDTLPAPFGVKSPHDPTTSLLESWEILSCGKLPVEDCVAFLRTYERPLKYYERGSLQSECDWEGIGDPLLEDVKINKLVWLSRILELRTKLNIQIENYPAAIRDINVNFAVSGHLGNSGGQTHCWAAKNIAKATLDRVEEIISRNGPNMGLHLRNLQEPPWSLRKNFQVVANLFVDVFPALIEVEKSFDGSAGKRLDDEVQQFCRELNMDSSNELREMAIDKELAQSPVMAQDSPDMESERLVAFEKIIKTKLRLLDESVAQAAADLNLPWKQGNPLFSEHVKLASARAIELDLLLTFGRLTKLCDLSGQHPLEYFEVNWTNQILLVQRINRLRATEMIREFCTTNNRRPSTLADLPQMPLDPISNNPIVVEFSDGEVVIKLERLDGGFESFVQKQE